MFAVLHDVPERLVMTMPYLAEDQFAIHFNQEDGAIVEREEMTKVGVIEANFARASWPLRTIPARTHSLQGYICPEWDCSFSTPRIFDVMAYETSEGTFGRLQKLVQPL